MRCGFTLIELLVVIGIMVVLAVMTLKIINVTQDGDRVRAAASQIGSFIEGARNRAVHKPARPHGVRILYKTETLPSGETITYGTGLLYVESANLDEGRVRIGEDRREIVFDSQSTKDAWDNLVSRRLMPDVSSGRNAVIAIRKQFFTMQISGSPGNYSYRLTKDFQGGGESLEYNIQLDPVVSPNQEPYLFPRDVVIDISNSQVPPAWEAGTGSLDIMFAPDGRLIEQQNVVGFLNLVVAEGVDVFQGRKPGDAAKEGEERVVSVHSKTGSVIVSHVDPTDNNNNGKADDPFNYALLGEPAR